MWIAVAIIAVAAILAFAWYEVTQANLSYQANNPGNVALGDLGNLLNGFGKSGGGSLLAGL